jgi:2-polyprenyl-3-methyl-5-hydroxy-6-metoxy-1,4-benzoquinol methylase
MGNKIRKWLGRVRKQLAYIKELIVAGGRYREKLLIKLLKRHYTGKFRRQWQLGQTQPHFEDNRIFMFNFIFDDSAQHIGFSPFYRGVFSSEVINNGDKILDIGCGDGFFTMRFFSERASRIDALDVEPSAIKTAETYNRATNVHYFLLDAVLQDFPSNNYNVVVWDGAIGHFSIGDIKRVLKKIVEALSPDGIFVGSESLGHEGADHLTVFETMEDVVSLLKLFFQSIQLRQVDYELKWANGFIRKEVYWRCSKAPKRLHECGWKTYSR